MAMPWLSILFLPPSRTVLLNPVLPEHPAHSQPPRRMFWGGRMQRQTAPRSSFYLAIDVPKTYRDQTDQE